MEALINFVQDEFIEKKEFPKFDAGDTLTELKKKKTCLRVKHLKRQRKKLLKDSQKVDLSNVRAKFS